MAARKVPKKALPAIALAVVVLLAWSALGGEGGSPADDLKPAPGVAAVTVQDAGAGGAESAAVDEPEEEAAPAESESAGAASASWTVDESGLPAYDGSAAYVAWDDGAPDFEEGELAKPAGTIELSALDPLGRVGAAFAVVGVDTMPTEERGDIGGVEPTGWRQAQYAWIDDGGWLYNRSHLLAHSLTSLDDDERNLMTGTRSMNLTMLDFEMRVKDYVEVTGNHVAYRVTPCFVGGELLARGVRMEAESVEDGGQGVSFDLYAFNVEPGVSIDYATGASWADGTMGSAAESAPAAQSAAVESYVLNTNSMKIHHPDCSSMAKMSAKNRQDVEASLDELLAQGYTTCGNCF